MVATSFCFNQPCALLDISCENIFALSIVTALTACPFSVKKCVKMSVFYVKTVKICWRPPRAQTPVVPPSLCQILGAPLAQTYHDEAMFSFGKLRKVAFGLAKRTHFYAKCTVSEKCTSSNITKTSCATCFQWLPYSIYSRAVAQTLVISKKVRTRQSFCAHRLQTIRGNISVR